MPRTVDPARRDAILDAAHSVFARKGYAAAGIADLAGELGIGHGTVYRYFANKRDVAAAVLDRALERIAAVVAAEDAAASATLGEYRDQVRRIGLRLYRLFAEDPALARLVFTDLAAVDAELGDRILAAQNLFAAYTAAYLTNGVERGFLRAGLDVDTLSRVINGIIFAGAAEVARNPGHAELRDRWIEAVLTLMFGGLARR
ncbi:helix-turn-helix domain-containing protein [Actinoplanes sp. NPDC051475]|uniref:helix-turn-helix domain-containing protein n=1 Tax=Actinoplanes sp. NPDC051475 TaxID=3157225 RepID=UPI00344F280D